MKIIHPDGGYIRVFGSNRKEAYTDRVGYLPEERGLYRKMKVRPLLRFFGEMKCGRDVKREVDHWLEAFGITDWADLKVDTLSKGMSQKIQFIAAVVTRPDLLILDEPFTGLDPVNTDVIRNAVLELQGHGSTVIFSTHDMAAAERMCDFIFMIFKGRKVLDGTLSSIQDEYGSDTIRLRTEDGAAGLRDVAGVKRINDFGKVVELQVSGERDPQEIVAEVMAGTRVLSFEVTRPSLHDIFVRIAAPEPQGVEHA